VRTIVDYNGLSRRSTCNPLGRLEIPRRLLPPREISGADQECSGKKRHYFVDTVVGDKFRPKK
jgi:hypothetical protein